MERDCLEKILAWIDTHIQEKITLGELAGLAGYTPFYFSRLFSEEMGMPVTGYIRIRKLQYATASLLEGKSVLEVSLLYGFESPEGFTRAFKRLFGSTPDTVRRHMISCHVPPYSVPATTGRKPMEYKQQNVNENLQTNLQQLVYEVLAESFAEAEEGYCSEICLCLLKDGAIQITDNGRGIPLSGDGIADRAVLDKILSGRPISNLEYSQMGDFSQIGMQTVNSLCESLQVCIYRDGLCFRQDYIRGIPQHEIESQPASHPRGMQITMMPDKAIFGDTVFSCDLLREWLAASHPNEKSPVITIRNLSHPAAVSSSRYHCS